MTRRYALRDDQWERIKNLLPGRWPLRRRLRGEAAKVFRAGRRSGRSATCFNAKNVS